MSDSMFRIHPSIGFARVGTSDDYYLAPETLTGQPTGEGKPTGGLPIRKGTEDETIKASDLRDGSKKMKRQAARFRIFMYAQDKGPETYPLGQEGTEIKIGSPITVGGKARTVADIVWTVHMANKKAAWYVSPDDDGIIAWYKMDPPHPDLRNVDSGQGDDPNDPKRLRDLIIDPGPRTIQGAGTGPVKLDKATAASYWKPGAGVSELLDYPKSFPQDAFEQLYPPGVEIIDTLGELETDALGRLIVAGGYGRANSFNAEGPEYGFVDAVNNDWWFDDTGDGSVSAVLVLDDGSSLEVQGSAWVVSTDPAYAPQIVNVVSLWDDVHDSWVRKLGLQPQLWDPSTKDWNPDYEPSFTDEVRPIFLAAGLQQWITNLSTLGISAHDRIADIAADTDPAATQLHGLGLIREPVDPDELTPSNPDDPNQIGDGRGDPNPSGDDRRMPLGLGDSGRSLLSLTKTQHFCLTRWDRSKSQDRRIELNAGEVLDKAALLAGLGGRFSPGIDMTYIAREPDLYVMDWQSSGTGPFRVSQKDLAYDTASKGPLLSLGWTPRRDMNEVEPGDISKFMALPWHADYNSCGTHLPAPNLPMANTLYWSWPAQRPVAVYVAEDVKTAKKLPDQRYFVRGPGTKTSASNPPPFGPANPAEVGRYQQSPKDAQGKATNAGISRILDNWMKIGTVIQATNIDEPKNEYDPNSYLEVGSLFGTAEDTSDEVVLWPNTVAPGDDG